MQFILSTFGSRSPTLFSLRYLQTYFNFRTIKQNLNNHISKGFSARQLFRELAWTGWPLLLTMDFFASTWASQSSPLARYFRKIGYFCLHWSLGINTTKLKLLSEPTKAVYKRSGTLATESVKSEAPFKHPLYTEVIQLVTSKIDSTPLCSSSSLTTVFSASSNLKNWESMLSNS